MVAKVGRPLGANGGKAVEQLKVAHSRRLKLIYCERVGIALVGVYGRLVHDGVRVPEEALPVKELVGIGEGVGEIRITVGIAWTCSVYSVLATDEGRVCGDT